MSEIRYLLVTPIPFAQTADESITIDSLWAEDLKGLAAAFGPVVVAAPKVSSLKDLISWGPGTESVSATDGLTFFRCR